MLEEIIQRNDAKYKLLSTPRGAISAFGTANQDGIKISVYGVAGKDGDVIIEFGQETKRFNVRRNSTVKRCLCR